MTNRYEALVIGASAGGVEVLSQIVRHLPSTSRLSIIIVLHQPQQSASNTSALFQTMTQLPVSEAEEKTAVEPGHIYFAPPGYHLLIENDRTFSLSTEENVNYSRPSIDVLFDSAAQVYQTSLVGLVLTGANSDGAEGLKTIWESGGMALVQDPLTARYPTMPREALNRTPLARALSVDEMQKLLAGL